MAMGTIEIQGLHQVAIRADDLDSAIEFYRDVLGASFIARFDPPGLAFFAVNGTRLLLEAGAPTATLYFGVKDVESAFNALRDRGVEFQAEPHLVHHDKEGTFGPPGHAERMAFFRDPSGNVLALVSSGPRQS